MLKNNLKILISGKGGCGKTFITNLLAREFSIDNSVLVIDADESNISLYKMLNVKKPKDFVYFFGGKKNLKKKLKENLFKKHISIEEIPREYLALKDNICIISVGKIEEVLEGCACPHNVLLKEFLRNLNFNGIIIIDTEAGVEHFGRGVEKEVDVILGIAEPTLDSIELLKKIEMFSKNLNKIFIPVINKVPHILREHFKDYMFIIPYIEDVQIKCFKGEEIAIRLDVIKKLKFEILKTVNIVTNRENV